MESLTKHSDLLKGPYQEASLLLVDKPLNWTSFDVVNKIRFTLKYHLGVKKIKVGHAGTLDPLATGLLLLCTGKGTKQIESFQGLEKQYTGCIKLGATTETYDSEKEEQNIKSVDHLTDEMINEAMNSFIGEIDQFPPAYSALKVDGQPLYKWTRKGVKKEIKSRKITFYKIEITRIELPFVYFCVNCSKGTYIRSLANDVGAKLGVGGYLHELTRTAIGQYKLEDAIQLEDWIKTFDNEGKETDVNKDQ